MYPPIHMSHIGDTVKFTCDSIHSVIWDFNITIPQNEILYYSLKTNQEVSSYHTILIHNITCSHKGQYGCYGIGDDKVTFYASGEVDIFGNFMIF